MDLPGGKAKDQIHHVMETLTLLRTLAEARVRDYIQLLKKRAVQQMNRNPKETTRSKPSTSIGQHVQVESYFLKRFLKLSCFTARPRGKRYISFSVFPEQLIACVSILKKEKPTVALLHDIKEFAHEESPKKSKPGMNDFISKYFGDGPASNAARLTMSAQQRRSKLHTIVRRFDFRNVNGKTIQSTDTGVQGSHTCKVSSPSAKLSETRIVDVEPPGEDKSIPEISTSEQQFTTTNGNRHNSQSDCARKREHPCIREDVPDPREDRSSDQSSVLKSYVVSRLSRKRSCAQRKNSSNHFIGDSVGIIAGIVHDTQHDASSVDHQYTSVRIKSTMPHDDKDQENLPHVGHSCLTSHSSEDLGTVCVRVVHRNSGPQDADVIMCKKDFKTGNIPFMNCQAMNDGMQELTLLNGHAVQNGVGVQYTSVTGDGWSESTIGIHSKYKNITEVHSSSLEGDDLDICSKPLRMRLRNRIKLQQSGISRKPNASNSEVIDLTSIGS
uniref:Uncharacterized protein n=2 Tax=Eptatretus burgeri TaxID=7764 RepID=A0A8C4NAL8_EPTBU